MGPAFRPCFFVRKPDFQGHTILSVGILDNRYSAFLTTAEHFAESLSYIDAGTTGRNISAISKRKDSPTEMTAF